MAQELALVGAWGADIQGVNNLKLEMVDLKSIVSK